MFWVLYYLLPEVLGVCVCLGSFVFSTGFSICGDFGNLLFLSF